MHLFGIRSYAEPPAPVTALTITSSRTNWNLLAELGYTPAAALNITITISAGKVVRSTDVANAAMDLSGLFTGSTLSLVNNGTIHGRGGDGAPASGGDGEDGGDAINGPGSGVTFSITNAAGSIFGGGGGGASGGNAIEISGGEEDPSFAGGGGGGGGAGGSLKGAGGSSSGGGANDGEAGTNGTTGSSGAPGTGGDGGSVPGIVDGGDGGDGGAYGAAGSNGTSGQHGTTNNAGGTGGAAGKAIELNGGSVSFVSGNTAARVKGAVS